MRVYLPPDANSLLFVTDHCLQELEPHQCDRRRQAACSRNGSAWTRRLSIAPRASASGNGRATTTAASRTWSWPALAMCRHWRRWPPSICFGATFPDLKIRVVNVVDLMTLQPHEEHPHGLTDYDFDALFTTDKPVIFAHHGYPWLIHRLTYRRANHRNIHVRGYKEEGTTTTPFDMVVRNDLDRFHLASDVIDRLPQARLSRRLRQAGAARQVDRAQGLYPRARRRHARGQGLALGGGRFVPSRLMHAGRSCLRSCVAGPSARFDTEPWMYI